MTNKKIMKSYNVMYESDVIVLNHLPRKSRFLYVHDIREIFKLILVTSPCSLAATKTMWRKTVYGRKATIAIWKQFFH